MLNRRRALMAAQGGSEPVYEHGTWEDLFQKIDNGTYVSAYSVGETLPLIISGTDYQAQIVAFDTDTLSGTGVTDKAAVTFVSVKLLNDYKRMNPAYEAGVIGTGALGGWKNSELRTWMNGTLKGLISSTIRARIKAVKKYTRSYNSSGSSVNNELTEDELWVPSYKELYNNFSQESSNVTYVSFFSTNDSKKKLRYTSARIYWNRTVSGSSTSKFSATATTGAASTSTADSTSTGVCVGFCVG